MTTSTFTEHAVVRPQVDEDIKDLGFGAEVARSSHQRLLNRDGTFNVVREGLDPISALSLYHWSLMISWPLFLTAITVAYIAINALFAVAFLLCGPGALQATTAIPEGSTFARAFFFSVQSFATIGYGHIVPVGLAANLLVTIEALINIVGVALATGLVFARFSRPMAKIIYSDNAIVAPYRNVTALEFRIANQRSSQIIEIEAKVILSKIESVGGVTARKFYELKLERSRVTFFALSWTIVHPIIPTSPLYGLSEEDLLTADAEIMILLTGTDETSSQIVHSRSSYKANEVIWNAKFSNIFMRTRDGGVIGMDVSRINDIERQTRM
ncbi:MAG: transporter [Gemmatimonadaceae bacterium]|nr:transporter [Gemmatimonadaceae bacterium]